MYILCLMSCKMAKCLGNITNSLILIIMFHVIRLLEESDNCLKRTKRFISIKKLCFMIEYLRFC